MHQITKIIDARGNETAFAYDPNGNLLSLTDARNKQTSYVYDSMDRVETRTDPLSRQETFEYDLRGNLTRRTDRKGQVTAFEYDGLDRRTFTGFGASGQPATYQSTVTTTWDAGDRPTSIVDSTNGTIARVYDLLDRLTEETTAEGTVTYDYDGAGRRTSMTAGSEPAVSYGYDAADRLTSVTQSAASVAFTYDAADRRVTLTLPNGVVTEYAYDADSQLTGLTYTLGAATLGTLTYSYDAAGRRTSVGGSWARTGLPPALASASYDAANQIVSWGSTSFSYDANGSLTSDGTRTYSWNARDELTAVTGGTAGSFAYDALGRRRSRTTGGVTTHYLYDALDVVQEQVGGSAVADYLLGLGIDERFTRTDGTGTYSYLVDTLGSTVALADATGATPTEYTYEPYGATTITGTGNANPARFTGREEDATGLYYYRARYYDSRLQRFGGEDPAGFARGFNLYGYAMSNPVRYRDPLGLFTVIAGAGGSVVGLTGTEASAGVAVNPGIGGCAGIGGFVSGGVGGGVNVGGDVFVGYVGGGFNNLSGETVNFNVTVGPGSVSVFLDPKTGSLVGMTVGAGPGALPVQVSGAYAWTKGGGYAPRCNDNDKPKDFRDPGGGGGGGGGNDGGGGSRRKR